MTTSTATVTGCGALNAIWSRCSKTITATFRDAKFLYLILRHPDTPWHVRLVLLFPVAYGCSPIQLFPNFIPVLGQLDDLFVLWIANRLVVRLVSNKICQECREKAGTTKLAELFGPRTNTKTPSMHQSNLVTPREQQTIPKTIDYDAGLGYGKDFCTQSSEA
jgi:uncharacterized membrane protein YkvA (DUF1232 family)